MSASKLRLAAEWEHAQAIWISWPHNQQTWPDAFDRIPGFFHAWAMQITEVLPLKVLVPPHLMSDVGKRLNGQRIELLSCPTNDCWIRDYGPTVLVGEKPIALDWKYNAWGGKYPPWDSDDAVAGFVASKIGIHCQRQALCLEGGALESDGAGRLLINPSCITTKSRNPNKLPEQITWELKTLLSVDDVVTLDHGLVGDDTDGHIDQLARFVDPANIVVAVCDDIHDPNHAPLEHNYTHLCAWGAQQTPVVKIHRLPIPPARFIQGQRLPESYCNFLRLGTHALHVPSFGAAKTDAHAAGLLRELSGVPVISVDCSDLIWGLGALHCASWNQPAV